jgi:simple sugar transport system permease protein
VIGGFLSASWNVLTSDTMYFSAFRLAALLAFAAVGEWIAERAGTLNISVEGMMLAGAFASAVGYDLSSNAVVGLLFAMAAGLLIAFVQATMSHRLTADQFVVGLTLNVLVLGLAAFLDSNLAPETALAKVVEIPVLSDLPLIGQALFAQTWPTYLIYPVVVIAGWLVYRTRWGLEVRAVGENPQAADVSGIHVNRRRRQAIYVEGMMAGLGGGYLVLGQVGSFDAGAVGGRGFIAIAAVIFGGWTLRGTILGCLVFGMADAFRLAMPTLGYQANAQLLSSLPYLLTVAVMILFARASRQPRALAQPFVRGLT